MMMSKLFVSILGLLGLLGFIQVIRTNTNPIISCFLSCIRCVEGTEGEEALSVWGQAGKLLGCGPDNTGLGLSYVALLLAFGLQMGAYGAWSGPI